MGAFDLNEMRAAAEANGLTPVNGWSNGTFAREVAQARAGAALLASRTVRQLYPASEAQLSFLKALMERKVVSEELAIDIAFELEQPDGPQKRAVSRLIDDLQACDDKPRAKSQEGAQLPNIPEGRYAVEMVGVLKFYEVDRPTQGKWAGYTFVSHQVSDDHFPVRGAAAKAVLAAIEEAGPRNAGVRYGHEIGRCSICNRTLTDETSRALGVGPVCAEKVGW